MVVKPLKSVTLEINQKGNVIMNQQKETPIVFQGKATEYFGIWIVNLFLSLVTLGVYSAWAKVRRKKYFYNNTLIENAAFDYHANPVSILKGRAIALLFFLGYTFSGSVNLFLPALFMLVFFFALPWLVVRSATFNARNTSHRGLRFNFVGTTREALRVFIAVPMLTLVTLGLIIPYGAYLKNKFMIDNYRFGLSEFNLQAKVRDFYRVYLKLFLLPFIIGVIGVVAAIAIPAYYQYSHKAQQHSQLRLLDPSVVISAATAAEEHGSETVDLGASEPYRVERVYSENLPEPVPEQVETVEQLQPKTQGQDTDLNGQSVEQAREMTIEEMVAERQKARQEKMREMLKNPAALFGVAGVLLLYLLFIFGFLGYLQARIGNLVWNHTALDKLSFRSSLRARDLIWIYMTNILAIALTFGLATPWAQVRLARYRTSNLKVVGDVDFDQFVGDKKAEIKATGEELVDMFDVDLSFG